MAENLPAAVAEEALWERLQAGDNAARERLVADNMQLVFWLAGRFRGRGLDWDDLCQVGAIGLLKAVDNFHPEYNNRFSTYAVPMIMGELKRALRDDGLLHISRSYKEKLARVNEAGRELNARLLREPTMSELAAYLDMAESELAEVLAAAQKPLSLQAPTGDGNEDRPELLDLLADEDGEEVWARRITLKAALTKLPPRLGYILKARYFREETQAAIAARLGISQVQVSRLEKQALQSLKAYWQGEK